MTLAWASLWEASQRPIFLNCLVRKTAPKTLGWTPLGTWMWARMSLMDTSPLRMAICMAMLRHLVKNSASRTSNMSSWEFRICWPAVCSSMAHLFGCFGTLDSAFGFLIGSHLGHGNPAKTSPGQLHIGCSSCCVLATFSESFCGVGSFLHDQKTTKTEKHKTTTEATKQTATASFSRVLSDWPVHHR